ncbi:hypothetical protein B9K05_10720 [Acetobacter syzygii]|uniref:Uncharacterized protein n=1 Tax=Acetobacter syzygii TaxID=146476 RepID=A0A270BDG4_9PROT|nr:hypothetical protein B9K05_10720 [Acetobacter syzygii]PAL24055.1 hypothetical protein B9K04_10685 [Acetobacter syzygii]
MFAPGLLCRMGWKLKRNYSAPFHRSGHDVEWVYTQLWADSLRGKGNAKFRSRVFEAASREVSHIRNVIHVEQHFLMYE